MGLSPGYLSKVKHGKEAPSTQLVALLALLATRPQRMAEIQRVWERLRLCPRIASTVNTYEDLPETASMT